MTLTLFIILLAWIFIIRWTVKYIWGDGFITFYRELLKNPTEISALTPCNRYVAQVFMKPILQCKNKTTLRILEVGAGTGSMTQYFAQNLQPGDTLDVVELNKNYSKVLTKLVDKYKDKCKMTVYPIDIINFRPHKKYDFIICTLPFTNMHVDAIRTITGHLNDLLNDYDGHLSYIQYVGAPQLKKIIKPLNIKDQNARLKILEEFRSEFGKQSREVEFKNIPPAYVYHLRR